MIQPIKPGPLKGLPEEQFERISAQVIELLKREGVADPRAIEPLFVVAGCVLTASLGLDVTNHKHATLSHELHRDLRRELVRFINRISLLRTAGQL